MMNNNFNEEIYDEEILYDRAVGAGVLVAIIGLVFSICGSIAMTITTTQSQGFIGLICSIISIIPATIVVVGALFVITGGLVYGWKFFTPVFDFVGWFLYLPIAGWFIFFSIKFVISISIGWIFFGYQFIVRFIDKIMDKKVA